MSQPFLSDFDLHLLSEGRHFRSFEKLGAHPTSINGRDGVHFAVWAPHARAVSVIGDFNHWGPSSNPLRPQGPSGIWAGFAPGASPGDRYKYAVITGPDGRRVDKSDPNAFAAEVPPRNASMVWDLGGYPWGDAEWMSHRIGRNSLDAPITIYEVHLGSWMRQPAEGDRYLSYREVAPRLADYAAEMGFTHVELMPVGEHPFDGSWGYQQTGYFAPTARFGTPQDFMFLVDTLHRRGLGVILDWVPAHFPGDEHGLVAFDGAPLYEYADPRKGRLPEWNTLIFDFGNPVVVNFLISNALFWLERYHIDGLRVDAVESLIRLDFSRPPGAWAPNRHGGPENLEAIDFLRRLNDQVHADYPGVLTIAEDATATPKVTRPTAEGGFGFDLKWDLGWVHDTLDHYMTIEPARRREAHGALVFRMHYAFSEAYLLPISHDEVKKGKGSLLARMPGDDWQRFANVRLLLATMYTLPGKKMLFMGSEIGQAREWDHDRSLDWHLLEYPYNRALRRFVRDLNTIYRAEPALHNLDTRPEGFAWIDHADVDQSVFVFLRRGRHPEDIALIACNFGLRPLHNYRVGAPRGGHWEEVFNSDAPLYGGSGQGNLGGRDAAPVAWHGQPLSLNLTLPPLGVSVLRRRR